ncbi:hypothetical protein RBU60_10290 [Mesonia sp. MT50]|uniref:Alcohol dehydrogenase-like C-terminal domain-containing protein n=1 Tax=Mesonia profundi TaxID=3070998 RepID=A0ABU1A2W3_9FLAO|nr:hypothetical protein [Mesonia profundi]MDQ7917965.1 hypothetical protein [Mesonia profundi]
MEKVNPDLAPISSAVSILGIPGLAAYFGMLRIGKPQKEETIVISGATGAVGSIAGQGCNVIGIPDPTRKLTTSKTIWVWM